MPRGAAGRQPAGSQTGGGAGVRPVSAHAQRLGPHWGGGGLLPRGLRGAAPPRRRARACAPGGERHGWRPYRGRVRANPGVGPELPGGVSPSLPGRGPALCRRQHDPAGRAAPPGCLRRLLHRHEPARGSPGGPLCPPGAARPMRHGQPRQPPSPARLGELRGGGGADAHLRGVEQPRRGRLTARRGAGSAHLHGHAGERPAHAAP